MEILSSMTARTDSGSGVRQRPGSGVETNASRFERMFEEELAKYDSHVPDKDTDTYDEGKVIKPVDSKNEDNTDEALAAGAMIGNLQNDVVIILEGEINSAKTPEIRVDDIQRPDTTQTVNPQTDKEPSTTPFTIENPEPELTATVNAESTMTKAAVTNAETSVEYNTNTADEVMARMPELRTQDRQESAENNSKQFENGNLSPLENENDKTLEVGQKDKTYSDAANAIKNAAEDKTEQTTQQEPIVNNVVAPPLSEGIKPEQFTATQQMTQAALNTPVKPENLFQEMISRVEMMQNDTKSTMTIQLNPEFLGKVALEVAVDAAGLHVKINAEDSGVRSMINGQLATLIESLETKGIEVVEVEVVYTGINYGSFQDPREGAQQQNKSNYTPKREVNSAEGISYYTTLPDLMEYYMEQGVSSVEYRA